MAKFGLLTWDWRSQIDIDKLNDILTDIAEPVRIEDVNTNADYNCIIVHTLDLNFKDGKWEFFLYLLMHPDDFPSSYGTRNMYEAPYEVVKDWLYKRIKKVQAENRAYREEERKTQEEKEIEELNRLKAKYEKGA